MLLKDYYIDKFTKRIKSITPVANNEYDIGLIDGLEFAIKILQQERTHDGQGQEQQVGNAELGTQERQSLEEKSKETEG